MELSGSHELEQPLLIKLEPLKLEPDWPATAVDPGPDPLALPVKLEPGAQAIKTEAPEPLALPVKLEPGSPTMKVEAGWPGGPEQAARAGAGPGRWLAAVRLSAADRAAAEAQLPRQQSPALATIQEQAYLDTELMFADLTDGSGDSDAEPGAQSKEEEWEPPKPRRRTRGLGGPGAERSCRQCPARFRSWRQLQQHAAAQHPGSTARSCTDRIQTLRRSSAQQQTVRSANHKKNLFQCQQCNKAFTRLSNLQMHERVHSGVRPFVCPDCGAGFKRKQGLQLHIRTHTGEKPHRCTHCGRGFAVLSTLRVHERTHTGARPYTCPDCGRRFIQKIGLRRHALMHSKVQPHMCEVCERRFGRIRDLHRHSFIHSGQKAFNCDSCDRSFGMKAHLGNHMRIHLREIGSGPANAQ